MKRDLDLVRTILIEIEEHPDFESLIELKCPGYSPEQVTYHVKLLKEAGLVEALDMSTMEGAEFAPKCLTWKGHEFLAATRNDGVWHKLKAEIKDRGVGLPFNLIQQLALKLVAAHYGL